MKIFIYLLQVSACTGIFYSFYYLFLRKLTFFTLNRWYLLISLLLSFVIPALTIPLNTAEPSPIMQPVAFVQQMQTVQQPEIITMKIKADHVQSFDWMALIKDVYIAMAVVSIIHLLVTLMLFFLRMSNKKLMQIGNVKVLKGSKKLGNSSFLNVIFINDDELEPEEIKQIITHEMLHIKLMHSADRLIARVIQIGLWFNPFAYCYIRSIEENHEFEVDRIAAGKDNKGMYATLLFKLAVSGQSYLFHGFSKVPLKTRIVMLFNKPTSNMKKIIYLLILPMVVISCLAFANLKTKTTVDALKKHPFYSLTKLANVEGVGIETRKIFLPNGKGAMESIYKAGENVVFIVDGKAFTEPEVNEVEKLVKARKIYSWTSGRVKNYRGKTDKDISAYGSYFEFKGKLADTIIIDTVKKYRQKTKQTPAQKLEEKKSKAEFEAYTRSADYKYKKTVAGRVQMQTLPYKVVGTVDSMYQQIHLVGYKLIQGKDEFVIPYNYGQNRTLKGLFKAGDEIQLKSSGARWRKEVPVVIEPALIMKDDKIIFKLVKASPIPKEAFLYEANKVRFTNGQVTNIKKYPNGKWKSAVVEVVNGCKIKFNLKPNAPDFKNIEWGDHVTFRFVHEVKTGAKEYTVNDWVSLSTDIKDYGIKNPDYFYKFYAKS